MKIGKLCTLFAQNSFSAVWRVWGKPVGSIFSCHAPTSPTACKVPVWHHLEFPDFISKEGGHIQGAVCRVPPIGALFKPSDGEDDDGEYYNIHISKELPSEREAE